MKNFLATVLTICHILLFTACGGDSSGGDNYGDAVGLKIEMIKIPGGTFIMGSPDGTGGTITEWLRGSDEKQHPVEVSGFQMGKYEVTQEQYKAVTGSDPSRFKGGKLPVEKVSWYDAVEFCNKLSKKEGLEPVYTITDRTPETGYPITSATVVVDWKAKGYRLPTEAEWEYACRGDKGTNPFGIGGDGTVMVDGMANFDNREPYFFAKGVGSQTTATFLEKTTVVGTYNHPNSYDLHDMHGNVYEWCWDRYEVEYEKYEPMNPVGPEIGSSYRVVRGGSWFSIGQYLRSAYRNSVNSGSMGSAIGFRVVCL